MRQRLIDCEDRALQEPRKTKKISISCHENRVPCWADKSVVQHLHLDKIYTIGIGFSFYAKNRAIFFGGGPASLTN